ncbi:DUF4434 domain-containing protein [Halomonas sp. V046]|uniref:DUF4434 domain-containing protein n=1 Tax=Halomonas sp. V046 TaxID=3459611 RepID=UPI0040442C43
MTRARLAPRLAAVSAPNTSSVRRGAARAALRRLAALVLAWCVCVTPALAQTAPAERASLSLAGSSSARPGPPALVFYQPQDRDATLSADQWQALWQTARAQGTTTLIVQWTRHGDDDLGGHDGWLAQALALAEEAGLALILGLVQDPRYYDILPNNARFSGYWYDQMVRSARQQQRLIETWALSPVGWYLPLELDDWLFRDADVRQELARQLASATTVLEGPLHLSMFAGGFLTPEDYAAWATTLNRAGWHVWWQDGEGTQALMPAVRHAYRQALPCQVGIIGEAFSQRSAEDEPFHAIPAAPRTDAADCHPRATFSLRYLPWARILRPNDDSR